MREDNKSKHFQFPKLTFNFMHIQARQYKPLISTVPTNSKLVFAVNECAGEEDLSKGY